MAPRYRTAGHASLVPRHRSSGHALSSPGITAALGMPRPLQASPQQLECPCFVDGVPWPHAVLDALLVPPHLQHDLRPAEEGGQRRDEEDPRGGEQRAEEHPEALPTETEPGGVGCDQDHDVDGPERRLEPSAAPEGWVPRLVPLVPQEPEVRESHLGEHGRCHDASPHEQVRDDAPVGLVPHGDEHKDDGHGQRPAHVAAQRDVQVPHQPLVEGRVPLPPETLHAHVVADAPPHVLRRGDAVQEGKETEESPEGEELEPKEDQVGEADAGELVHGEAREVDVTTTLGGEEVEVVEVQEKLDTEDAQAGAKGVLCQEAPRQHGRGVLARRGEVVERHDGPRDVQRRVAEVLQVSPESVGGEREGADPAARAAPVPLRTVALRRGALRQGQPRASPLASPRVGHVDGEGYEAQGGDVEAHVPSQVAAERVERSGEPAGQEGGGEALVDADEVEHGEVESPHEGPGGGGVRQKRSCKVVSHRGREEEQGPRPVGLCQEGEAGHDHEGPVEAGQHALGGAAQDGRGQEGRGEEWEGVSEGGPLGVGPVDPSTDLGAGDRGVREAKGVGVLVLRAPVAY